MVRRKNIKDVAYSGKHISYNNKTYTLVPELVKGMCQGCDLYDKKCTPMVTSLCTQGFIFKRDGR